MGGAGQDKTQPSILFSIRRIHLLRLRVWTAPAGTQESPVKCPRYEDSPAGGIRFCSIQTPIGATAREHGTRGSGPNRFRAYHGRQYAQADVQNPPRGRTTADSSLSKWLTSSTSNQAKIVGNAQNWVEAVWPHVPIADQRATTRSIHHCNTAAWKSMRTSADRKVAIAVGHVHAHRV